MARRERSDKGVNRSVYVIVPCDGCPETIRKRRSELRATNWHSRECYQKNGAQVAGRKGGRPKRGERPSRAQLPKWAKEALSRLDRYEALYGPLPDSDA